MSSELATQLTIAPINDVSIYNPQTFQQLVAIADLMANTSLIPETLRTHKVDGKVVDLPIEKIKANCFLVAEQSLRWNMSPFAAAACASVIYGRLMWEGKLVSAVITAKLGLYLDYKYAGAGENMSVTVSGTLPGEQTARAISGKVSDWKTDQWAAKNYEQRLSYRGAREWARRHAPGVLLGIITDDDDYTPSENIRNVTPPRELPATPFQESAPVETTPAPTAKVDPPKPAAEKTPEAPAAPPEDRVAALIKSVTRVDDTYLITLRGAEKEIAVTAADSEIGKRAMELEGLNAWVVVKSRNKKPVLLSIALKDDDAAQEETEQEGENLL